MLAKQMMMLKIKDIEDKLPSITILAITAALSAVENKIPNVSDLVKKKKTEHDAKIKEIDGKYFITSGYDKFTNDILDANIKNIELVNNNKSDISEFLDNSHLDKMIKTLAIKAELKAEQDKIVKLQTHDLSYFPG